MARILELPVETLQRIGQFLSVKSKAAFKQTYRDATVAFYDDQSEQSDIWDLILKDRIYFDQLTKDGVTIVLVGTDLRFISNEEHSEYKDLILALVFIIPQGESIYRPIQPEDLRRGTEHARCFRKANPELCAAWHSERKRVEQNLLAQLHASLRSTDSIGRFGKIQCDTFALHVGSVTDSCSIFDGVERLALSGEDETLLLYYKGGPNPMRIGEVKKGFYGKILTRDKKSRKLIHGYFARDDY